MQRGVLQILQPLYDPGFSPNSMGYRPGRGRQHALALAESLAFSGDDWFWVCDDIENAFDHVPLQRLFEILQSRCPSASVLTLVERIVQGAGPTRTHGIRQGGPLSPFLLNVILDRVFDRRWSREHPDIPCIRYADDLLVLCRTRAQAEIAYADLRRMLMDAGFALKGCEAGAIQHVSASSSTKWLGMEIGRARGRLRLRLTDREWDRLAAYLHAAQLEADGSLRATEAVHSMISQVGPAYQDRKADEERFCQRIRQIAFDAGFDEIPSAPEIVQLWRHAAGNWEAIREQYR